MEGKVYQYVCLHNGLSSAPRIFTKPVFKLLRKKGFLSSSYTDDVYLKGDRLQECYDNAMNTVKLLRDLEFVIHKEKSNLEPSQQLTYLGFDLDSAKRQ